MLIHPSSQVRARTVILSGVKIGPRMIVNANLVMTKSLPSDTLCTENPAWVICGLDEYLDNRREKIATRPTFA